MKINYKKLLLTSTMSALFCGSSLAATKYYTISGYDFGSSRSNAKLEANVSYYASSEAAIFVWAKLKDGREFCFDPSNLWTQTIVNQPNGIIEAGGARCQYSAGKMVTSSISSGKGGAQFNANAKINILQGMDLSDPIFDDTMVYVGISDSEGYVDKTEYKDIYKVKPSSQPLALQNNWCKNPNGIPLLAEQTTYKLGNIGPAGGIVFNLDSSGKHGLEAQACDYNIGGDIQNCYYSESHCFSWAEAQTIPSYYGSEWRLPDKDQINQLYIQGAIVGGFGNNKGSYWSSTEFDATNAWYINATNGALVKDKKEYTLLIRAIRPF